MNMNWLEKIIILLIISAPNIPSLGISIWAVSATPNGLFNHRVNSDSNFIFCSAPNNGGFVFIADNFIISQFISFLKYIASHVKRQRLYRLACLSNWGNEVALRRWRFGGIYYWCQFDNIPPLVDQYDRQPCLSSCRPVGS